MKREKATQFIGRKGANSWLLNMCATDDACAAATNGEGPSQFFRLAENKQLALQLVPILLARGERV